MTQKMLLSILTAFVVLISSNSVVLAESAEQDQKLEQKVTVKCETGAYGQIIKCESVGEQKAEQRQRIVMRPEGQILGKIHQPVAASLDLASGLVAGVSMASGVGAYLLKRKLG